jgi:hypothetical protein
MKKVSKRKSIHSLTGKAHITKKDKGLEPATKEGAPVGPPGWFISALTADERKSVKKRLDSLLFSFRNCEIYLRDYSLGGQNVVKFLGTISYVQMDIEALIRDLFEKHQLGIAPGPPQGSDAKAD